MGLAIFQLAVALAFLIPILVNVLEIYSIGSDPIFETVINEDTAELFGKAIEVLGECIMFIAFEVWRIWLAFDGVNA